MTNSNFCLARVIVLPGVSGQRASIDCTAVLDDKTSYEVLNYFKTSNPKHAVTDFNLIL